MEHQHLKPSRATDASSIGRPVRRIAIVCMAGSLLGATSVYAEADRPPQALRQILPQDLSPWAMFLNADAVVKGILIGLLLASVATWAVAFAKGAELFVARRRCRRSMQSLDAAHSLTAISFVGRTPTPAHHFAEAALREIDRSADIKAIDGIKERIGIEFQRIESAYGRRAQRGLGILATIGATGPFVGLFGTVWGIMNSFIGISKSQTTNLAVVAPGIAEALLATAVGLAAAIPAVVIYNTFARMNAGYKAQLGDAAATIIRLAGRDLDRRETRRETQGDAA